MKERDRFLVPVIVDLRSRTTPERHASLHTLSVSVIGLNFFLKKFQTRVSIQDLNFEHSRPKGRSPQGSKSEDIWVLEMVYHSSWYPKRENHEKNLRMKGFR